jgi:hypothetical protein
MADQTLERAMKQVAFFRERARGEEHLARELERLLDQPKPGGEAA